ncbi:hypothetical protein QUB60_12410 [Microcoleus sp. A2-C5]|uniref:hypothetical protein n=1 Tax=Microcoleaceae TaxID=1892252 RepID=UPI00223751D8|nr:hypothetical protein [Lyngbya sp. CCAP 1446/10]MCW6052457.1 hypothetical protein [Lyngbya sp. CCAP 1446/10]
MQVENNKRQGSFSYWQNKFIHQNMLTIGYTAWNGFLTLGRGMTVCDVDLPVNAPVNWQTDTIPHYLQFITELSVTDYLRRLELEPCAISNLLQIIATYNPTQEIIILLTGDGQIEIDLLQRLAIPPVDCYDQVRQRWGEFQLYDTSQMRRQ